MIHVAWVDIDSKGRLVSKRKAFKTDKAMRKFINKLIDDGRLYKLLGISTDD